MEQCSGPRVIVKNGKRQLADPFDPALAWIGQWVQEGRRSQTEINAMLQTVMNAIEAGHGDKYKIDVQEQIDKRRREEEAMKERRRPYDEAQKISARSRMIDRFTEDILKGSAPVLEAERSLLDALMGEERYIIKKHIPPMHGETGLYYMEPNGGGGGDVAVLQERANKFGSALNLLDMKTKTDALDRVSVVHEEYREDVRKRLNQIKGVRATTSIMSWSLDTYQRVAEGLGTKKPELDGVVVEYNVAPETFENIGPELSFII